MLVKGPLIVNDMPPPAIYKNIRKNKVKIADGIRVLIVVQPVQILLCQRLKACDIRPPQTFVQERLQGSSLAKLKGKPVLNIRLYHFAFVDINFGPLVALGELFIRVHRIQQMPAGRLRVRLLLHTQSLRRPPGNRRADRPPRHPVVGKFRVEDFWNCPRHHQIGIGK